MATGDITVRAVLGTTDYNGFAVELTFEGLTAATLAYDAGLDADNNPTANTPYIDLDSEGYDATATLGTVARRVYLTRIMRRAFPNQAQLDITDSSGNAVVKFSTNADIYDDDTNLRLTFPAGRVTDGTNSNTASSAATVTNGSTLDYPTTFGQWDNQGVPGGYRVTGDFTVGFMARGTHPIAAVRFDSTGDTSTHNQNATVASQSSREWAGSGLYSNRFQATHAIAGFTQGEAMSQRARVYPAIGDADSVFDTDNFGSTLEVQGYSPVKLFCDKTSALVQFAVIDQATGNDSTGVVSATLATAEANRYLSIGQAIEDGATVVYLVDGTHPAIGTMPAALTGPSYYAEVRPHPTLATAGNVIVEIPTTNRTYRIRRLRYVGDIIVRPAGAAAYLQGATNDTNPLTIPQYLWFDGVDFDINSVSLGSSPGLNDRSAGFYMTNCTGDMGPRNWKISQFSTRWSTVWQRGCDFVETSGDANAYIQIFSLVGNRNDGQLRHAWGPGVGNVPYNDGILIENNLLLNNNRGGADVVSFTFSASPVAMVVGMSVQGNVVEKNAGPSIIIGICVDTALSVDVKNVLIRHNTFVGERANLAYNSQGTVRYARQHWSNIGNCYQNFNIKSDDFGTGNGARTGSWPMLYGVNASGNHYESSLFDAEFSGFNFSDGDIAWPDDRSGTGTGAGGGTYTAPEASVLRNRLSAAEVFLPFDLTGRARPLDGKATIGAYQYDETPPAPEAPLPRCTTLTLGTATSEAPGDVAWGTPGAATDGDPGTAATAVLDPGQTTQVLTIPITLATEIRDKPTPVVFTILAQRELVADIINITVVRVVNNDSYDSGNLLATPITPDNGSGNVTKYRVKAVIPSGELAPSKSPLLEITGAFVSGVGSRLFIFDVTTPSKICAGGDSGGYLARNFRSRNWRGR